MCISPLLIALLFFLCVVVLPVWSIRINDDDVRLIIMAAAGRHLLLLAMSEASLSLSVSVSVSVSV